MYIYIVSLLPLLPLSALKFMNLAVLECDVLLCSSTHPQAQTLKFTASLSLSLNI